LANGLIFAGVGAGAGVTPPLVTFILMNWGWRWSFYVSALIGLAAGAIWYLIARDRPAQHPRVSKSEAALIEAGLPPSSKGMEARAALPFKVIFRNRSILAMTISYFGYGYVAFIFFSWFFIYLSRVRGLDLKSSAIYSMLPFMAMAVCSPFGGWIADILTKRYGKRVGRCGLAVVGLAGAAIFIALATQVESARLASIVLAGGAGSLYLAQSAYWAVTADVAGRSAGVSSGLMNMGAQIGSAVTASLTPWVADQFGWTASFLLAASMAAMGAIAWLFVDANDRLEKDPIEAQRASA
jgi:ACS family glucarate transporter-like MFS transporter